MPLLETSRLRLYAERRGEGPRVLWIGGTGGDLRNPPDIFKTPLGAQCDLLAYDQRGLGQSDKPEAAATMADYADDAAALLDAIGWERAHVIGYSFGGMVAQHVAIRHGARVERLVLAATSPGGEGGSSYPLHDLYKLAPSERLKRHLMLDARITEDAFAKPDAMLQFMIGALEDAEARRAATPGAEDALLRQLAARADHNAWNGLPTIAAPTFVAAGAYDRLAQPQSARNLAARLPHATLRFYPAGHMFMLETPAFFDDVLAFLRGDALAPRSEQEALA